MKTSLLLIQLFILSSCGLSTGLYDDILEAQDSITKQKFDEAASIYEKILLKKPSKTVKIKVNYQLGEIYSIYLNDFSKSISHFSEIVKESNEPLWEIKALERLASIYFNDLKDYKKSEEAYFKLSRFYPPLENNNFYHYQKALSIFEQKRYMSSIKLFDKIIEKKSQYSVRSYHHKGLAYFYVKDYKLALNSWFEYLKREKRSDYIVQTKFLIANAYESSEKLKEAYNIYYSLLGEYPNAEVIKNRLNSLYERRVARKR